MKVSEIKAAISQYPEFSNVNIDNLKGDDFPEITAVGRDAQGRLVVQAPGGCFSGGIRLQMAGGVSMNGGNFTVNPGGKLTLIKGTK